MGKLTGKQQAFIDFYFQCGWNASEAARRAGYKGQARSVGSQLLANISVSEEIARRVAERAMSSDEVLDRYADQARGTIADFVTITRGKRRSVRIDLGKAEDANKLHLIKKIGKTDKGWQIELYDVQTALAQIGKALRLFIDRHEFSGPNGGPIPVEDARAILAAKFAGLADEAEPGETSGAPGEPSG